MVLGERLGAVGDHHPVAGAPSLARPAGRHRADGVGLEVVAVDAGAAGGADADGAGVRRDAVGVAGAGRLAGAGAADVGGAGAGGRRRAGSVAVARRGRREGRSAAGGGRAGGAGRRTSGRRRCRCRAPFVPQVVAPASLHWLSGSAPAGTATQVPTEPARLHALQVAAQAVAQQTPCAQKPELQVLPRRARPSRWMQDRSSSSWCCRWRRRRSRCCRRRWCCRRCRPCCRRRGRSWPASRSCRCRRRRRFAPPSAEPLAQVAGAQAVPAT